MATAAKEELYTWEGLDRKGNRVKGESNAGSEALMKAELRRQGINPVKVRKKPKPLFQRKKKIKGQDIAVFSRQLATMMASGVPLVQALETIGQGHDNPSMRELVDKIKADVEGGTPLAEALARYPRHFDALFVNLVRAGEQSGSLDTILNRIATYKEKTESLKGKIKKALFYPAAVLVVAFVVTSILLLFVVPQFQDLFRSFGADLPAFTLFVIGVSDAFQQWWWAVFGGIILAVWGFLHARRRSANFRRLQDRVSLRIPVIGEVLRKASIARFSRTLSTTFGAGVPLVEALDVVSGATGNALYEDGALHMRDEVTGGTQLQYSMKETGLFPNMVVQMTAIGEESGALDTMLAKVADFYEEEVDNAVDSLSSLLEPLIMVVIGGLVGSLVIAMYLPIFKLGQVV